MHVLNTTRVAMIQLQCVDVSGAVVAQVVGHQPGDRGGPGFDSRAGTCDHYCFLEQETLLHCSSHPAVKPVVYHISGQAEEQHSG